MRKCALPLLFLLFAEVALGVSPNDNIDKVVVGVDVPALIHSALGDKVSVSKGEAEPRGVTFSILAKDGKTIGIIQLGVFGDKKIASKMLEAHILRTSMGPDRMGNNIGEKAAVWKNRIVFVRNNAIVSLVLRQPELLITTCKSIDNALAEGKAGVKLGTMVHIPRIIKVALPERFVAGTVVPIKVQIVLPKEEIKEGNLSFTDNMGKVAYGLPIVDSKRDVLIQDNETILVYTAQYHVPKVPGKTVTCWACYATRDCCTTTSEKVVLNTLAVGAKNMGKQEIGKKASTPSLKP